MHDKTGAFHFQMYRANLAAVVEWSLRWHKWAVGETLDAGLTIPVRGRRGRDYKTPSQPEACLFD